MVGGSKCDFRSGFDRISSMIYVLRFAFSSSLQSIGTPSTSIVCLARSSTTETARRNVSGSIGFSRYNSAPRPITFNIAGSEPQAVSTITSGLSWPCRLLKLGQRSHAIDVGHRQIENHQIRRMLHDRVQGLDAVGGLFDFVTFGFEAASKGEPNPRLIV